MMRSLTSATAACAASVAAARYSADRVRVFMWPHARARPAGAKTACAPPRALARRARPRARFRLRAARPCRPSALAPRRARASTTSHAAHASALARTSRRTTARETRRSSTYISMPRARCASPHARGGGREQIVGDVLERALGRLLGLALHEERVVRFLGDVLQCRLIDSRGVL